jgi:hypothetical protein
MEVYNVFMWLSGFIVGMAIGVIFLLLSICAALYKEEIQDAIRKQTEAIQARIRELRWHRESKKEESREEQSKKDDGDRWTRPQG